jgi:hypothetical protein
LDVGGDVEEEEDDCVVGISMVSWDEEDVVLSSTRSLVDFWGILDEDGAAAPFDAADDDDDDEVPNKL